MSLNIPSNAYVSGGVNGNCGHHSGKTTAIFKKRFDRIDWKKLAAADVEHIAGNLDYNTLQENIHNVAFCNIDSELDLRTVDPNFVKLYKLAQLTIEYLLFSQEYLNNKGKELDSAFKKESQDHLTVKEELDKVKQELGEVKKESHKRKKMILAQQQMLQSGQNSYNKCPYCSKAFVNASFLQSHLLRRHLDGVGQYNSLVNTHLQQQHSAPAPAVASVPVQQQPAQQLSQSTPIINVAPVQNTANEALERQLEEIRERLQSTENQLTEERNGRNTLERKDYLEQSKRDLDLQQGMEQWKAEQLDQHRDEMDKMRDMFMKELKEMNEKLSTSEQHFVDSQKHLKKQSNLGIITDDLEYEKEQLAKQREEVAELREQLHHQTTHVEELVGNKMDEKEKVWQERLQQVQGDHERQLGQLSDVYETSLAQLELERERRDMMLAKAQRKKEKEREREQKHEGMKKAPEPSEPRMPVEALPLKAAPSAPPAHSMAPMEDDDATATEDLETTLGGTSTYGTRTFPTFGTGTLSLSEARNGRLADILRQNPEILLELKSDLNGQLDHALAQRGIKMGSTGVPTSVFNAKMHLLKGERQQRAKKYKNFFEIRQHYLNQVDAIAKDKLKAEAAATAAARAKQAEAAKSRPTSAPLGARTNGQQERLGQSAPLPSTAVPSPQVSRQPPRPAPRVTSPQGRGTNGASVSMSMTSTGQSYTANTPTGSSSQWDSDYDDEDETDDDDDDETDAAQTPQKSHKVIQEEEDDDDDDVSFLEDLSDLEEVSGVGKAKPVVKVPQPKGGMVMELSRSIELQLQGRGKKPAGAINTVSLEDESSITEDAPRKGVQPQDDDSFPSVTSEEFEEEPVAPKPILKKPTANRNSLHADSGSYSTNTYNTSMWGGSSSKAGSTAMPAHGASIAKTSMNVSEWDSDDDIEELTS